MLPNEHHQAQALAAEASLTGRRPSPKARSLYADAAKMEEIALSLIPTNSPRTRGILGVSLVALLYKAALYDEAELAAFRLMLESAIPAAHRLELRKLLESISDERSMASNAEEYAGEELVISLRQGKIGFGTAPIEAALYCIESFRNLIIRAAELVGSRPFRPRGRADPEISESIRARVGQPAAGSYRMRLAFVQRQQSMFEAGRVVPSAVCEKVIEIASAACGGTLQKVEEVIPDISYRIPLMKLVRNIFPPAGAVGEVEIFRISTWTGNAAAKESVLLNKSAGSVAIDLLQKGSAKSQEKYFTIHATLRAVHLDKHWVEVTTPDGKHLKLNTGEEEIDDVIGPMLNHRVLVSAHQIPNSQRIFMTDIQPDVEATED